MSEQIREQVSAFLDGELPSAEAELLLKRLTRDAELRESFGRYALIGESLRGGSLGSITQGFTSRVNRAIDGEPATLTVPAAKSRVSRGWRSLAGVAVAAGVAAIAIVSYQQRVIAPVSLADSKGAAAAMAQNVPGSPAVSAKTGEALSYTVPQSAAASPMLMPAARLTNYVFAHSKYSAVMGQNDVLNDLLSDADAEQPQSSEASQDSRAAP
jgi:sigma-E factor negative regulatory protein RseA